MSAPELDSLKTELIDAIQRASNLGALEEVRVAALGRKGRVSELMRPWARFRRKSARATGRPSTA